MLFDEVSKEATLSLKSWKVTFDNPDFLGWTVVTAYIAAGVCCGRAALKSRVSSPRSPAVIWWLFSVLLITLGINKQLNLQTLMIVIGRTVASDNHWYGERRRVQLIFSVVFAAFLSGALAWFWWRYREFLRENQLVLAGAIVLMLFVTMRAATINHADSFLHIDLKDKEWAWVLEITGSVLIAAGALQRSRDEYRR